MSEGQSMIQKPFVGKEVCAPSQQYEVPGPPANTPPNSFVGLYASRRSGWGQGL